MPVYFSEKIKQFSTNDIKPILKGLVDPPELCPICNHYIAPQYLMIHKKGNNITEILCGCPRVQCNSLFFAVYEYQEPFYEFRYYYPESKVNKEFPEEVSILSPSFVEIYNEAYHAEQEGLGLIAGVGYRKALEFLIKDYSISINPDEKEKIEKMLLKQCVDKYIDYHEIKEMAKLAILIGNDETHYVRKFENKDIQDLKKLIDLTVYFLSMTLKAKRYTEEIIYPSKQQNK
jgi:hypothetical protein